MTSVFEARREITGNYAVETQGRVLWRTGRKDKAAAVAEFLNQKADGDLEGLVAELSRLAI